MPCQRKKHIYYVQVARQRIETSVIKVAVDAEDDELAAEAALDRAEELPPSAWQPQPFNPGDYRPFVQALMAESELKPPIVDELCIENQIQAEAEIRYLLLKANCDTGEGKVVLQPWLVVDPPDLLASDLAREWANAVDNLELGHLSARLDDLAGGAKPLPSDRILFGMRTPRKPKR